MGADGYIVIYDLKKIKEEVTDDELQIILGAQVYIQAMNGEEYLTSYRGSNIYIDAQDWTDVFGYMKQDDPYYVSKDKFDSIWERIRKHRLALWEVWT
jgi:hypothetical protein